MFPCHNECNRRMIVVLATIVDDMRLRGFEFNRRMIVVLGFDVDGIQLRCTAQMRLNKKAFIQDITG